MFPFNAPRFSDWSSSTVVMQRQAGGAMTIHTLEGPAVPTLAFGSASEYVQVAPGTYRVRVARVGSPSDVLVDLGSLTVGAGAVRTLLVTDAPSGGFPTNLAVITDA